MLPEEQQKNYYQSAATDETANKLWSQSKAAPEAGVNDYRYPVKQRQDVTTKVVVTLIVIFGVVCLGIGAWILKSNVTNPFKVDLTQSGISNALVNDDSQLKEELKTKDTDSDGLNDYQEVYTHNTSPYLRDTDSDGIPDGTEISQGKDPNCAEGETCRGVRLLTPDTKLSDIFPQFSPTDSSLKDKTLLEFRQILIDSGLDADTVAGFTDDFLLLVLQSVMEAEDTGTVDLQSLSEQEIRDFMIDVGLQPDEVNKIPPDELKELIKVLL